MLVAVGGNEEHTSALAAREDATDSSGSVPASDITWRRRNDVMEHHLGRHGLERLGEKVAPPTNLRKPNSSPRLLCNIREYCVVAEASTDHTNLKRVLLHKK